MVEVASIQVEVCYAMPDEQIRQSLHIATGSTLQQAIMQSGLLQRCPDIDLMTCRIGIYGKLKTLDTVLREHDRIEIYRPLIADPKDSRRQRATKKRVGGNRAGENGVAGDGGKSV